MKKLTLEAKIIFVLLGAVLFTLLGVGGTILVTRKEVKDPHSLLSMALAVQPLDPVIINFANKDAFPTSRSVAAFIQAYRADNKADVVFSGITTRMKTQTLEDILKLDRYLEAPPKNLSDVFTQTVALRIILDKIETGETVRDTDTLKNILLTDFAGHTEAVLKEERRMDRNADPFSKEIPGYFDPVTRNILSLEKEAKKMAASIKNPIPLR